MVTLARSKSGRGWRKKKYRRVFYKKKKKLTLHYFVVYTYEYGARLH